MLCVHISFSLFIYYQISTVFLKSIVFLFDANSKGRSSIYYTWSELYDVKTIVELSLYSEIKWLHVLLYN